MTNADFEEIYKKYRGFSKWLAGQLVHNSAIAEDISQEAFASIYNMSEELDLSNERKTGGLVKTVTFNKVRDYFKSPQRQFENNTVEITDEENLRNLSYEIDDLLLEWKQRRI